MFFLHDLWMGRISPIERSVQKGSEFSNLLNQSTQMECHVNDGEGVGYGILVRRHDRGHDNDVGDFADFRRLDVEGKTGNVQPASVTGAVVRAEGDQQKQQETVKGNQPGPVLGQHVQIHGGNDDVSSSAHENGEALQGDITEVAVKLLSGGGAGNTNQSECGNQQAQDQQKHIAFFTEIF